MLPGPFVDAVGMATTLAGFKAGYGGARAWGAPSGSGLPLRWLRIMRARHGALGCDLELLKAARGAGEEAEADERRNGLPYAWL